MSAPNGRSDVSEICRNGADDPFQTEAASPYGSTQLPKRQAPFGDSGLGGLHGDKDSLQIFSYKANTAWNSARRGTLSASGKPSIDVGSPPEFKGEPDIWAPEELLVGSVNTCMMLTFLTLAQAKGLTPVRYESEAEGLLENIEGKYRITEVMVRPRVSLKDKAELERAREIMDGVEAQCFISNSIKSKVLLAAEFVVAPSPK